MKKILFYAFGALLILGAIYFVYRKVTNAIEERKHQEWVAGLKSTASPNVQILTDTIEIDYLGERRTLSLYLPEDYATDSVSYPVIYFLDGQSPFDEKIQEGSEWQVDEVLDSLGKLGQQQAIIVGIYNSDDRLREYKPIKPTRWNLSKKITGDKHAAWIVAHLKPWIDEQYRTQPEAEFTVIAGASLGGLMSYYMAMKYPEVFGRAIVFSPSFWVNDEVYQLHESNDNLLTQKIYFNSGELEYPTGESVDKMHKTLLAAGMPAANMKVDTEPELGHWHLTWRAGFPKAYPWIVE